MDIFNEVEEPLKKALKINLWLKEHICAYTYTQWQKLAIMVTMVSIHRLVLLGPLGDQMSPMMWDSPLYVYYEYILLPLVNKEAALAYGRAE